MKESVMNRLEPLVMPLKGLNLIEASAGTGKTYTITTLYLRILLGLADPDNIDDGLSVDQILVVTFTEAATEEIRDRVRRRLNEAKQAIFLRNVEEVDTDIILHDLIAQLPDPQLAYKRLDAAIKMMDEAAIFTIHGFCQRMLKHHAFESGSLFDNEFILDEREYLEKSIKDFWRCTVYPMSGTLLSLFLQCWSSPKVLLAELQSLLNKHSYTLIPQLSEQALLDRIDEYGRLCQQVKSTWVDESIPALINDSMLLKSRKPAKAEYLEAFTEFCTSDELEFVKGKDSWEIWSEQTVTKATKKGKESPAHPVFATFSRLAELKEQIKGQVYAFYKQKAFNQVKENLIAEKLLNQKISPDDLLTNLAAALGNPDKGETLAKKIAAQFPVAMIDEFQDTDPLQYGIFNGIYAQSDGTMIMIGDPKQAIYGFRGADIFTYIKAKKDAPQSCHYTLDKNWRSTASLIGAVNGLFQAGEDAFIYSDSIPFNAVKAATKADETPLIIDGDQSMAALNIWQLAPENDLPISKTNAIAQLAVKTANEIATLLLKAQNNQAHIGEKPVAASDICVLVRDRNEADSMRQALTKAGVSSVYLSRQSVFETPLAYEFYLLLQAIYEEKNERAIRAALITPFFDYSINQLWSLTHNEDDWQRILNQFAELHKIWFKNGVMAVLQHLLSADNLASRWKSNHNDPQRMLTDIRHIGELLQQKSMELDGVHRLLGWFHEQLVAAKDEGKVQQLRLEDDSNLVQIVTMHASKGLEYNVVFLPFVCGYRMAKSGIFHDDRGLVIDFANSEENLTKADKERLAEDLRLLYVALTRGVYRCYLGIFNLKVGNSKASHLLQTALGYLLFKDLEAVGNDAIYQRLTQLSHELNLANEGLVCQVELVTAEVEPITVGLETEQEQTLSFERFKGQIEYDWKVTSYSALANGVASVHVLPGSTDEGYLEGDVQITLQELEIDNEMSRFTFPKGSNPGSCLHEIFENIDFTEFNPLLLQPVEQALHKFGIDEQWTEITADWVDAVLNTSLNTKDLCLADINNNERLVEMEFYLPMDKIKAWQINQILSEHLGKKISVFDFNAVKGILKGYIDLIFVWQGKYFVLDYKSNHLGNAFSDYQQAQLEAAMSDHHYHLQYLLYTLALHRFLKQRLPDYDYDQHVGGNYYLFLRGMDDDNEQFEGVYFSRPKQDLIEKLDGIFAGENDAQQRGEVSSGQQLGLWE